ncbi:hypothetical protein RCL1_001065 [Eukaryota sp. TZLM3-RCL]
MFFQTSCQCSQLECRLSLLEDSVSDQKNDSITLNDKLNDISSATYTHISTLNDRIRSLEAIVLKQTYEMSLAHAKIEQLSSDQSNLIDQFKELLPSISHIKVHGEEKRRIEEEQKQNEFKSNPIQFICKYPSEIFSRFGDRTKFIGETKGSRLELSNDDCLVRSTRLSCENSFIAINHPLNGRITLTLRSTNSDGRFFSCIGYFNPNICQDGDCCNHFIGINPFGDGTYFYTNGSNEPVTSKLSPSQSIIISFENSKVTYSTPHSGWTRTVDCVDGWVFGIFVVREDESWSIK